MEAVSRVLQQALTAIFTYLPAAMPTYLASFPQGNAALWTKTKPSTFPLNLNPSLHKRHFFSNFPNSLLFFPVVFLFHGLLPLAHNYFHHLIKENKKKNYSQNSTFLSTYYFFALLYNKTPWKTCLYLLSPIPLLLFCLKISLISLSPVSMHPFHSSFFCQGQQRLSHG